MSDFILMRPTLLHGASLIVLALSVAGCASSVGAPPASGAAGAAIFPTYERQLLLETASEASANISFGDLDGDGNLDIVLAKGRHWPLVNRVLFGDGQGGVRNAIDLGAADRSYSALLTDMNGDGALDIVVSNDAPDAKVVYLNSGRGQFRPAWSFGQPEWSTRNASSADVNGDGRPDIIVANRGNDSVNFVCLNRGDGASGATCEAFARYPATTITPVDTNDDGRIDLVTPHRDGGQSYVYRGHGDGRFSDAARTPFGAADAAIRMSGAADFNGDHLIDIVTIDERKGVAVYLGRPNRTFSPAKYIAGTSSVPYALSVADLNDDSAPDIIVGHVAAPSTVYFNDGGVFRAVNFGDAAGTVYGFAVGDFDRDGIADIGAARSDAPNMIYFGSN